VTALNGHRKQPEDPAQSLSFLLPTFARLTSQPNADRLKESSSKLEPALNTAAITKVSDMAQIDIGPDSLSPPINIYP